MATSSIRIKKICQWCGTEFEAQKVSTKYCSHRCVNLAYKQAIREKRVKQVEATRYDEQLYTIFTTNLTPAQLEEKYGRRTVDRLNEMVEKVVFENESYRR